MPIIFQIPQCQFRKQSAAFVLISQNQKAPHKLQIPLEVELGEKHM